ncbi:DUF4817 domain-containing protein [Trichonephila clavipes]|nr:DUF4817 domain-containing protein [Trichonephila clavipes]
MNCANTVRINGFELIASNNTALEHRTHCPSTSSELPVRVSAAGGSAIYRNLRSSTNCSEIIVNANKSCGNSVLRKHNVGDICLVDVKVEDLTLFILGAVYIHPKAFVEWAQNEIAVVPDFHKRILFSDEAHFWLNGYVNKQDCRIWSEANPQVYVETPLHPEKLTVWCALWAGGIIGPYFFKNDEGHNVTVNGDRYRAMITNFFIPELNNHDVQELWFQQDGATCHTARATIDLLKDTFGDRLISRFGPVNWSSRSCDLTPLDYFLWGYVKSLVYADKTQTLDHLEDNIRGVIADIRPQMLEKVIENWTSRLDYIRDSRGSPMPEIIFKM